MVYFVCHCYLFLIISVGLKALQSSCLPVYLYICLPTLNKDYFTLLYFTLLYFTLSKASACGLRSILNSKQTGTYSFGYLKPVEVQTVIIIFFSV